MPLPSDFNTGVVTGKYVGLNGEPLPGKVTFSARVSRMVSDATDTIVLAVPLEVTLSSEGEFSIELPATDDPDISPVGFTYEVTESIGTYTNRFDIEVPVGSTQDISEVVEVTPAGGTVVWRRGWVHMTEAEYEAAFPGGVGADPDTIYVLT